VGTYLEASIVVVDVIELVPLRLFFCGGWSFLGDGVTLVVCASFNFLDGEGVKNSFFSLRFFAGERGTEGGTRTKEEDGRVERERLAFAVVLLADAGFFLEGVERDNFFGGIKFI
jgi:hypothetical protein